MDNKNPDATRIVYFLNDQDTPYLTKLNIAPNEITLADFKNSLEINAKNGFKFFFKSFDEEVGIVKEEIIEDNAKLPLFKGRVVAWLVPSDGTNLSDRSNGLGSSNSNLGNQNLNNKFKNPNRNYKNRNLPFETSDCDTTETESILSNKRDRRFNGNQQNLKNRFNLHHCCNESMGLTSDIDSATFVDTDDESYYHCPNEKYLDDEYENDLDECDNLSHFSTTSEETSISRVAHNRLRKKKKLLHLAKMQGRASSANSIADSTVSTVDIITVDLELTEKSFLGMSLVGQCYENGDHGIYVGSIMKEGLVEQDGRISVGDLILKVNGIDLFEQRSNDDAVKILREVVNNQGPIKLTVAKHKWLSTQPTYGKNGVETEGTLNLKDQPVRPIDPRAWVEHTKQINRSSKDPDAPEIDINNIQLTNKMKTLSIARAMSASDSGLEVKNRTWLKITFSNAFLGSDVVNWLYNNVKGFNSRKDAKKFAVKMLSEGHIKHTLNKNSFSEQCYYTFSESIMLTSRLGNLDLNDRDNSDSYDSQNLDDPSQFLPRAQQTINYGNIFEYPNSSRNNGSNNRVIDFQVNSVASSYSDQLSQTSGPIPISQFQQKHQQFFNSSNQQQQAQSILSQPPFAPQPNHLNQGSSFLNQFESVHLRTGSSNSSEQSSLNTLSTRDTAIGVGSNCIGLISSTGNNPSTSLSPNNILKNNNLSNGLSNLLSNNGLPKNAGLSNNLSNNVSNNLSNLTNTLTNQQENHLIRNTNNAFNMANLSKIHHLNNHSSFVNEINGYLNEINDDDHEQLIINH